MRIFLTGGTGFIGCHFVDQAMDAGYELICLKRPGSQPRIKLNHKPEWLEGSLTDNWCKQLSKCDIFVHLAAHSTNIPYDSLENCLNVNLTISLQIIQQASAAGIRKFIIAGTGFEYGLSGEEYEFIPIDAPLKPTMTYAVSKAASSIVFHQWAIDKKLKLKYLRIFQVFGDGEDKNRLWPSLKKAAFSGEDYYLTPGEQIRDFTPVKEVAKSLINDLDFSDVIKGDPIIKHIGSDRPQSIREFAEFWWKKWRATGKLHFGAKSYRKNEVMRYVPKIY